MDVDAARQPQTCKQRFLERLAAVEFPPLDAELTSRDHSGDVLSR